MRPAAIIDVNKINLSKTRFTGSSGDVSSSGGSLVVSAGAPSPILYLASALFDGANWTDLVNPAGIFGTSGAGVTKSGNYISFNGTDYLLGNAGAQPVIGAGKNFTISLWLNFSAFASDIHVLDSKAGDGAPGSLLVEFNPANNRGIFYNDNSSNFFHGENTSVSVPTGEWHLWTFVVDRLGTLGAPSVYIYKDTASQSIDGTNLSLNSLQIGDGTQILALGAYPTGGNAYTGLMGNVRIWDVALTSSDVESEYLAFKPQFPAPTAASSSKQFPLANAVYVDSYASTLRTQGILAYATLEEAFVSWKPTGEAYVSYGAPSAVNPACIVIGIGVFSVTAYIAADVPFLSIVGVSRSGSILQKGVNAGGGGIIQPISTTILLQNLTLDSNNGTFGGSNSGSFIEALSGNPTITLVDVDMINPCDAHIDTETACTLNLINCTMNGTTGHNQAGLSINGNTVISVKGCTINHDNDTGTGAIQCNQPLSGVIENTTIKNTTGITIDNGNQISCRFKDCTIIGFGGTFDGLGAASMILDSYLLSTGGDAPGIVLSNSGTVVSSSRIIGNGAGVAIDGSGITVEITHCRLRMPTGDVPGSSAPGVSNSATTPLNVELIASTTV